MANRYLDIENKTLVLDRSITANELKDLFSSRSNYQTLVLVECDRLNASSTQEHIPYIRNDLECLVIQETLWFDDETLELLTAYCNKLKRIELIGCLGNITTTGVESIGRNCGLLEALSIVCPEGKSDDYWQLNDKLFPALINSSSSSLSHFALSGFTNITFEGLRNLLNNFKQSLRSLNVSCLPIINEKVVKEIGEICTNITSLDLSFCSALEEEGLISAAELCSNLQKLKICGLELLTDNGVFGISRACPDLKEIYMDCCVHITERSIAYIGHHCTELEVLSMKETNIRYIPYSFMNLTQLRECNFCDCDQLTNFNNSCLDLTSVQQMKRLAMSNSIKLRTKVMVLGSTQSGKTSTLLSLQTATSAVADGETFNVPVSIWSPYYDEITSQTQQKSYDDNSRNELTVELWDCSGRKCLQGIHPLFISKRCLFLFFFNSSIYVSPERVVHSILMIHAKVPGACVILVASNCDMSTDDKIHSMFNSVEKQLAASESQEIDRLREKIDLLESLEPNALIDQWISSLERLIANRPKIIRKLSVSAITATGIEELRESILKEIHSSMPPLHISPRLQDVYDEIIHLRAHGNMVLTMNEMMDIFESLEITKQHEIQEIMSQLEELGCVLKFNLPGPNFPVYENVICIDPPSFANAMASLHRHEDNPQELVNFLQRAGHIDRLWPLSKPNDWTLRGAFTNITANGMIRETVVPLLLHKWDLKEHQAVNIISLMQRLNILVSGAPNASYDVELLLPNFPLLSVYKRFFLPQLGKLPIIPQVNAWLTHCPKTHLQVGWRYKFHSPLHPSLFLFLISSVTAVKDVCEILSFWQNGVYLRVGDVDVAVIADTKDADVLDVLSRVRYGNSSQQALGLAWTILARFLFVIEKFLGMYRGIFFERLTMNASAPEEKPIDLLTLLSDCLATNDLPSAILHLIPNHGLQLLNSGNDFDDAIPTWLYSVASRVTLFVSHTPDDTEAVKSILHHFQSIGFLCACSCTSPAEHLAPFLKVCSLYLVVHNASRTEEGDIAPELRGHLDDREISIVVALLGSKRSPTTTLILPSHLKNKPTVEVCIAETSVSKDKTKALLKICLASLFGTGDVEQIRQLQLEKKEEIAHQAEGNEDDELAGQESAGASTLKINQLSVKRSVQFADQSPRHHHNRMTTDGELKQLAAATVAAAVAAATAEHIAKQSNPTMGAKAAAMAAKVADAVARGDSDAAAKAVIATARAVDEVVAMRSCAQPNSANVTNGGLNKTSNCDNNISNNNNKDDYDNDDNDYQSDKKSTVCVIL